MVSLTVAPYRSVIARRGYIGDLRAQQALGNCKGLLTAASSVIIKQNRHFV